MGERYASLHLRCEGGAGVLAELEKRFSAPGAPNETGRRMLEELREETGREIAMLSDPLEREERSARFAEFLKRARADLGLSAPALVVVREHFVSLYQHDHIRCENIEAALLDYAQACAVPVLGTAVYDDVNFQIYAARDIGNENGRGCKGEYMFGYGEVLPADPAQVCDVLDAPFLREALERALSCGDGAAMAAAFQEGTGLSIRLDKDACRAAGMRELCRWPGAAVFSAQ